jgi:hypothetical protein
LRQWMIGAGLWVRRKDRLKRVHQPRARRDCLGELVQIGFLADYNARFGKEPRNPKNLHRPLSADDNVGERYADFGPTLAAEKLSELHGLDLGVATRRLRALVV